jgi:hypothetical protein
VRSLDSTPGRDDIRQLLCFLELVDRVLDFLPAEIREKTVEIAPPEQFSADFGRILVETAIADYTNDFDGFSGGEFGGAGATRDFGDGDSETQPGTIEASGNPFAIGPCGYPFFLMPIQTQCLETDTEE